MAITYKVTKNKSQTSLRKAHASLRKAQASLRKARTSQIPSLRLPKRHAPSLVITAEANQFLSEEDL